VGDEKKEEEEKEEQLRGMGGKKYFNERAGFSVWVGRVVKLFGRRTGR
jgi:hypothetical protein